MSTKSYVADKRSAYAALNSPILALQSAIQKRKDKISKLGGRSGDTSWTEFGKRQYLGNEVDELKRKNETDASKIKGLEKAWKNSLALLNEAIEIDRSAADFRAKYLALARDADQRLVLLAADVNKIDARTRELEADYKRAGPLEIAAKGFIRDKQKALKAKRDSIGLEQKKQKERKQAFASKITLVDKVTSSSGLAGWGVAALGGLFVAANI